MNSSDKTTILVVDDNPIDVRMICFALAHETTWHTQVEVTDDGEKAVHYLLQQEPYDGAVRPDLLILDLNLPKRNGTEILRMVRTNTRLSELPVVILSSPSKDVIKETLSSSYFTADLYLTRPVRVEDYLALGASFRRYYEDLRLVLDERKPTQTT